MTNPVWENPGRPLRGPLNGLQGEAGCSWGHKGQAVPAGRGRSLGLLTCPSSCPSAQYLSSLSNQVRPPDYVSLFSVPGTVCDFIFTCEIDDRLTLSSLDRWPNERKALSISVHDGVSIPRKMLLLGKAQPVYVA